MGSESGKRNASGEWYSGRTRQQDVIASSAFHPARFRKRILPVTPKEITSDRSLDSVTRVLRDHQAPQGPFAAAGPNRVEPERSAEGNVLGINSEAPPHESSTTSPMKVTMLRWRSVNLLALAARPMRFRG